MELQAAYIIEAVQIVVHCPGIMCVLIALLVCLLPMCLSRPLAPIGYAQCVRGLCADYARVQIGPISLLEVSEGLFVMLRLYREGWRMLPVFVYLK